jgi:hypothetical protein
MSPDPFIQAPDNWVNYNRYGYCLNNPLIYTDPSGYKNWQSAGYWTPQIDPYQMWDYLQGARDDSWGSEGRGYGGGGGSGGGFTSWNQILNIAYDLLNHSASGGISKGPGQTYYFKNDKEAYFVGNIQKQQFGGNNYTTGVDASNGNQVVNVLTKDLEEHTYEDGRLYIKYGPFSDGDKQFGSDIKVRYTGLEDMSNAYWTQWIETNDPVEKGSNFSYDPISGVFSYWDDTHSHTGRYYSNREMAQNILCFGTSVSFGDGPHRSLYVMNIYWYAQLSLINNGKTVLQIYYGFSIDSTGTHPMPYSYKIYE